MPYPSNWRVAKSLLTLRDQIDVAYPGRSKASDGTIGNPEHASRTSDHNPDADGVVRALDITHDPSVGLDTWALADVLRQNRDPRILNVISNGRIFSSEVSPWTWRPYTGANKHAQHIHIAVVKNASLYDDTRAWNLTGSPTAKKPAPTLPRAFTPQMRQRMADKIIEFEARRDAQGRLQVYRPDDGSYEVGGLNSTYFKKEVDEVIAHLNRMDFVSAENYLREFVLKQTVIASGWTTDPGVEFMLRDCVWHRGATGAAIILQRAVGVEEDGEVGPVTRGKAASVPPGVLLSMLRNARESYELSKFGKREKLWPGLVNRWNKALALAQELTKEGASGAMPAVVTTVIVGTGTAATATVASQEEKTATDWVLIAAIIGVTVGAAVLAYLFLKRRER